MPMEPAAGALQEAPMLTIAMHDIRLPAKPDGILNAISAPCGRGLEPKKCVCIYIYIYMRARELVICPHFFEGFECQ